MTSWRLFSTFLHPEGHRDPMEASQSASRGSGGKRTLIKVSWLNKQHTLLPRRRPRHATRSHGPATIIRHPKSSVGAGGEKKKHGNPSPVSRGQRMVAQHPDRMKLWPPWLLVELFVLSKIVSTLSVLVRWGLPARNEFKKRCKKPDVSVWYLAEWGALRGSRKKKSSKRE